MKFHIQETKVLMKSGDQKNTKVDHWFVTCAEWERLGVRASFGSKSTAEAYAAQMTREAPNDRAQS